MHRVVRACAALVVALLIAVACSSTGDDPTELVAPTVDLDEPFLLPDETGTPEVITVDGSASADETPTSAIQLEPVATPTVAPPAMGCIDVRQRYAQLLMPLVFPEDMAAALEVARTGELGGIALLGNPGQSLPGQLAEIQQASELPVMVASDEEGGTVQRLANLIRPLPSAAEMARLYDPQDLRAEWLDYGTQARELGIHVILGPVVDVGGGPGIGTRSFADTAVEVTSYARSVTEGLLEAGITPVLKHFPGHGRASGDSHLGLPVVPELSELRAVDLQPYIDIVGGGKRDNVGVMVGHLSVPGLTEDLPTSLSVEAVSGILRNEIGFGGLVFSDAMNMGAIVERVGALEAIELSIRAGTDIVIIGRVADVAPALDHLEALAAEDPQFEIQLDRAVRRVLGAKDQLSYCAGAQ